MPTPLLTICLDTSGGDGKKDSEPRQAEKGSMARTNSKVAPSKATGSPYDTTEPKESDLRVNGLVFTVGAEPELLVISKILERAPRFPRLSFVVSLPRAGRFVFRVTGPHWGIEGN